MSNDGELVLRSLEARDAFDELVTRHYSMVYSVAYGYVGQREAAEEVAQETFLRAYLNLAALKEPAAFGGWLMRIARNLAENWRVRGQTRSKLAAMVPLDEIVEEPADERHVSAHERLVVEQEKRAVHAAMEKLPAPDREIVMMHFLEGISQSDIARRQGVYPSTVGRQLERALDTLRKELGSVFPRAAAAVRPSRSAEARVGLLVAAASALPLSAKAALAEAAAESATAVAASITTASNASTATHGSGISSLTPGGMKMVVAATLATLAVGVGVILHTFGPQVRSLDETRRASMSSQSRPQRQPRVMAAVNGGSVLPAASGVSAESPAKQPQEILGSREAEKAALVAKLGGNLMHESWASGAHMIGMWGEAGDSLEWEVEFSSMYTDLKLGMRYAYHHAIYVPVTKPANPRGVQLYIDEQGPIFIPLDDTQGWNWFKVASVALPPIEPGKHKFKVVSPVASNPSNLDCFTFYRGDIDPEAVSPLRSSVLHETSGILKVLASPLADLPVSAKKASETFEQLRKLMIEDFGHEPPPNVLVHFADVTHWDDSHGRAVKNRHGIYLLGDGKLNRADWCWALAQYFGDTRVPRWFRDSSARVSGVFDWLPAIDEGTTTSEDVLAVELTEQAQKLLADPESKTTRVEVVNTAVRTRHGGDVFSKFWKLIRDDAKANRIAGAPPAYDKTTVMAFMTQAAGADVTPLYRQWTGFADEGPVDPLIVTDVATKME